MKNEETGYQNLSTADVDRIMEMGWEDRTPFEAIEAQFGLAEKDVIALMRKMMKASSFKMWRKRMAGRSTKHLALRAEGMGGFKSNQQRAISMNKISKR
ncbi:TIGR03643 family protein [Hymenobacter sp. HD11105]